jgi:hypothetical protein
MPLRCFFLLWIGAVALMAADKYTGPRPPQPDIPYLLHADHLVPTEVGNAREDSRKGETAFVISGASSSARTPISEPIFIVDAQQIAADRMEMYRLEVRNGNREATFSKSKKKGGSRPIHVLVTRLGDRLYRIEADEPLENGEYSLSPSDSNKVFCFEIY